MNRPSPASGRPLGRIGAVLLAVALLWAQALGLAHRVQHAPGTPAAAETGHDDALHDHAPQSGECRLFDQLAAGDAAPAAVAPVVAAPPPAPVPAVQPAPRAGLPAAGYRARAPPPSV